MSRFPDGLPVFAAPGWDGTRMLSDGGLELEGFALFDDLRLLVRTSLQLPRRHGAGDRPSGSPRARYARKARKPGRKARGEGPERGG